MRRVLIALCLFCLAAWAANVKLYLKDGTYQIVREYKVNGDRVRFYSVERSNWEEMPTELVDLKRTESEATAGKEKLTEEAKVLSEKDKAERALKDEAMKTPQNPGVYYIDANQAQKIKPADTSVHTNKGRSVLKAVSPIPMV